VPDQRTPGRERRGILSTGYPTPLGAAYERSDLPGTLTLEARHYGNRRVSAATAEAGPCEPIEAEVIAFNQGWDKTLIAKSGRAEANGLRAAFALFGPRYFDAELRRRVAGWKPTASRGWVTMGSEEPPNVVHLPTLLRALSGRDGGGA
jgi:hypothetical protein